MKFTRRSLLENLLSANTFVGCFLILSQVQQILVVSIHVFNLKFRDRALIQTLIRDRKRHEADGLNLENTSFSKQLRVVHLNTSYVHF